MNKTKINWCDATWNPVTGCQHGCEYCYARRIARRFGKRLPDGGAPHLLERKIKGNPYPYIFEPTFHAYRLEEPLQKTAPLTIFVCSMADLFGDWVPEDWIMRVFRACEAAPQHRYLFLTKNPARYAYLADNGLLPRHENFWYGSSTPTPENRAFFSDKHNTFLSVEPILGDFRPKQEPVSGSYANWVILGAMTGPGCERYLPGRYTIDNITRSVSCPVFMKNSLIPVVGEENMRRELPWEGEYNEA